MIYSSGTAALRSKTLDRLLSVHCAIFIQNVYDAHSCSVHYSQDRRFRFLRRSQQIYIYDTTTNIMYCFILPPPPLFLRSFVLERRKHLLSAFLYKHCCAHTTITYTINSRCDAYKILLRSRQTTYVNTLGFL